MNLSDVLRDLEAFDADGTIYAAKPWTENSEAIVAREPEAGGLPVEAKRLGLDYFLETFIACEFLERWMSSLGEMPTLQQKCARLISYATHDA